ncbi:MAG: LLM class F420-dependent oxidoreductase, partial [Deltaproteobacteria bacterium]|nr:LLM class F420-dependent oxidoreductase [Deltaproteobacteria bacterium]
MRFGYLETMTNPAFMRPLAVAAEEAGYDTFVVPDSICYPEHSNSKYPYTEDGDREFLEDK